MDNQRAGGLGHNNDFISGEDESKDRMSGLLHREAQVQSWCDSVSGVTRLRAGKLFAARNAYPPVPVAVCLQRASPPAQLEVGTCNSECDFIKAEREHQQPGLFFS